ncbi:MAG: hypothetical protein ABJZ55_10880 [Fuerstiella sp.]
MALQPQEIPFDDAESVNMFRPSPEKPLVATPGAIEQFSHDTIVACWNVLTDLADEKSGLDYLQVFVREEDGRRLWFLEDGEGGAITALTPDEY